MWSRRGDRALNAIPVRSGGIEETGQVVGHGYFEHKREEKTCSFDCVYCQLGGTENKTAGCGVGGLNFLLHIPLFFSFTVVTDEIKHRLILSATNASGYIMQGHFFNLFDYLIG